MESKVQKFFKSFPEVEEFYNQSIPVLKNIFHDAIPVIFIYNVPNEQSMLIVEIPCEINEITQSKFNDFNHNWWYDHIAKFGSSISFKLVNLNHNEI